MSGVRAHYPTNLGHGVEGRAVDGSICRDLAPGTLVPVPVPLALESHSNGTLTLFLSVLQNYLLFFVLLRLPLMYCTVPYFYKLFLYCTMVHNILFVLHTAQCTVYIYYFCTECLYCFCTVQCTMYTSSSVSDQFHFAMDPDPT